MPEVNELTFTAKAEAVVASVVLVEVKESVSETVGVVKAGLVAKTARPEPVSSDRTPANWAEVVEANCARVPPVYATVPPLPKATEELSVPVKVRVLDAVRVFELAIVRVPVEVVMVSPLTVVGVIAPSVKASAPAVLVAETPLPVVTELTRVPLVGRVKLVVPVEVKVTEFPPEVMNEEELANVNVPVVVVTINPLMEVAVATPRTGVTSVGLVAKTARPEPVSSDRTPANWAEVVEAKALKLLDVLA